MYLFTGERSGLDGIQERFIEADVLLCRLCCGQGRLERASQSSELQEQKGQRVQRMHNLDQAQPLLAGRQSVAEWRHDAWSCREGNQGWDHHLCDSQAKTAEPK